MLFSNMTLNPQPLHIDAHFCATETEWGRPLMNSLFTLGLMIGISVNDTTVGTTIANLGMTDVASPPRCSRATRSAPTTEVLALRESQSRPDAGLVEFRHRAFKQDGVSGRRVPPHRFHAPAPEPQRSQSDAMRSLLFVPGDDEKKLAKALESGADALILDLEDSVACAAKPQARATARRLPRASARQGRAGRVSIVRVNPLDGGLTEADLDGVLPSAPDGIVLPKSLNGAERQQLSAPN